MQQGRNIFALSFLSIFYLPLFPRLKKLVKQYLLYMSPQYGELRPRSFVTLGHPRLF